MKTTREEHNMLVPRRSLLRIVGGGAVLFLLAVGSIWMSGCGGGDANTDSPIPQASPSPVVLPQEYRLAYQLSGKQNTGSDSHVVAEDVQISPDGSLLVLQNIYPTNGGSFTALVRHTNYGKPGESQTSFAQTFDLVYSFDPDNPVLGVSPRQEIYLRTHIVGDTPMVNSLNVSVLSYDGTVLRRIDHTPSAFDSSGNFYANLEGGVYSVREDGRVDKLVLPASKVSPASHLAGAAVSPQGEIWSYSLDGFITAKTDGSGSRFVPVNHIAGEGGVKITRCDGEGNLFIDQQMPKKYPNNPVAHDLNHQAAASGETTRHHQELSYYETVAPYIRKFKQDGTELAAIPIAVEMGVNDFNVDVAGNVYVATSGGVYVYQRVR